MRIFVALAWVISIVAAFTAGEMRGHRQSDEWWNKNGARVLAGRAALIYGPEPVDSSTKELDEPK